jgi:hypothetical protein
MAEFNKINLPHKDQLALAALAISMDNLRLKQSRSLGVEMDSLGEIDAKLDQYLSELK